MSTTVDHARLLRAMLRLGSFTYRELQDETGLDASFIYGLLNGKYASLVDEVKHVRTGRVGPPEKVMALRPKEQKGILEELRPFYAEMLTQGFTQAQNPRHQPQSSEFGVAAELIDGAANRGSISKSELNRTLGFLKTASLKEGVPSAGDLREDSTAAESGLEIEQQIRKAHLDVCRGKLCWILVAQDGPSRGGENFLSLGLRYLQNAARTFTQNDLREIATEVDLWGTIFLGSLLSPVLNSPEMRWFNIFCDTLATADSAILPKVSRLLTTYREALTRFIFFDPKSEVFSSIEVYPKKDAFELGGLSFGKINPAHTRPNPRYGTVIHFDNVKTAQGLARIHHSAYPEEHDPVVLVNVRPHEAQMTIAQDGRVLLFRDLPGIEIRHERLELTHSRGLAWNPRASPHEELAEALDRGLEFIASPKVERTLYVTGDPVLSRKLVDYLRNKIGHIKISELDPLRRFQLIMDPKGSDLERKAKSMAAELGFIIETFDSGGYCPNNEAKSVVEGDGVLYRTTDSAGLKARS
jgi:hypothetical protein